MLTTEVENYPGFPEGITGPDMMENFQKQAERFGSRVRGVDVTKCDFSSRPFKLRTSEDDEVLADTVIIATGATANWIGLENELRLATTGGGVSACAVCDGALPAFRDQPLAVVGGGDSAMEEASYLAKFGSTVYVIHRRDTLRASKAMQDRVLANDTIKMVWNSSVVDVLGDKTIEAVELEDTVTGERSKLEVRGLFVAIGHTPATSFLEGSNVAIDDAGYVLVEGDSSRTNIEGVFAAGDVSDSTYRQAVTAAGMGCRAALDAERWLSEHE
jgi:thioredoxin reductase (NADPH)